MKKFNLLSIIIPVYNEAATILAIIEKIAAVSLPGDIKKEIIIINDSSGDDTHGVIWKYLAEHPLPNIYYFVHATNQGKGAAVQTGIAKANGDYIVIQDADLEYDPRDYALLIEPILQDAADVVYGSRFVGGKPHRTLFFWHYQGNRLLTFLSNMFTNLNLTDMETCYKLFPATVLKQIPLKEKRFGFEPEITAKIARIPDIRIYEVGISYYGRNYKEGKKITWRDGLRSLFCILKYNLFSAK